MSQSPAKIVYFGDSLTDDGNLAALGEATLDPAIVDGFSGPTGAVSDGPTHASYTTAQTGAEVQNYAVASAEVDGVQTFGDIVDANGLTGSLTVPASDPALATDINLNGQVNRYLSDNSGTPLASTSAVIWIGANDYNEVDPNSATLGADIVAKMNAVVYGIAAEALRLDEAGVGEILIATLPSASFFAGTAGFSDSEAALANAVFATHNVYLGTMVDVLTSVGISAKLHDVGAITEAIVDDATGFGLIAPYGDTQTGSTALSTFDPDQIAFFDDVHPSTATHGVIGAFNAMAFSGASVTRGNQFASFEWLHQGADFAAGLAGNDVLRGLGGDDVLLGGTGDDDLAGHAGSDLLSGGQDNDTLRGRIGNDILGGGWGDDIILGGAGADVLIDGLGSDRSYGAIGNDTFIFTEAELIGGTTGLDADMIDGGDGTDVLIVVLGQASFAALAADLESGAPTAALASLGITATSIESIVAIDGRDGLERFASESWYGDADIWGLI